MKTLIATVLTKNVTTGNIAPYTFIFNDDFHAAMCEDSSIQNANKFFLEAGRPDFVGQFGKTVGFAPLRSVGNYPSVDLGNYRLFQSSLEPVVTYTLSRVVDGRAIPVLTGSLDSVLARIN